MKSKKVPGPSAHPSLSTFNFSLFTPEVSFRLLLIGAAALGAFLRLRGLSGQILLDDEWHSLNFVLGKSLPQMLLTQGLGANSIPVNLYSWILYHTAGWSEPLLRLPFMAAGALSLLALPLLARRLWGSRVAALFAYLLAISPLAVFYSRLCRPYSMALLFGAAALFSFLLWLKEGRRAWGWAYLVCGWAAIYCHPLAAIAIFSPPLIFAARLFAGRAGAVPAGPRPREVAAAATLLLALSAASLGPAYAANPWWTRTHAAPDHAGAASWMRLAELMAGAPGPGLAALFCALAAWGWGRLYFEDRMSAAILGGAWAAYVLFVKSATIAGIDTGIVIARYGAALIPALLLFAARGLAAACEAASRPLPQRIKAPAGALLGAFALAAWLAAGPLGRIYGAGSNFTHHRVFQENYAPIDWTRSREVDYGEEGLSMPASAISPCYARLASLPRLAGVIEYPLLIGDSYDLAWYFQHFHGKPVAAGYWSALRLRKPISPDGYVLAWEAVDGVLARVPSRDRGRLGFWNVADVGDPRLASLRKDWAVVLHADPPSEDFPRRFPSWPAYSPALSLSRLLRARLGTPFCESGSVQAFLLR